MTSTARHRSIAIYTRSSRPDPEAHLRQYAAAHQAVKEKFSAMSTVTYSDNGYEGASLQRPALKAMLREVDAGNIQAIVVTSHDRLSRTYVDILRLQLRFERAGVPVCEVRPAIQSEAASRGVAALMAAALSEEQHLVDSSSVRPPAPNPS